MSKCISAHGEFSEHEIGETPFMCEWCGEFDTDSAVQRIYNLEAENRKLTAKIDAVKAALYASDYEPSNRIWHEQMQRLRAILADTDEGNESNG